MEEFLLCCWFANAKKYKLFFFSCLRTRGGGIIFGYRTYSKSPKSEQFNDPPPHEIPRFYHEKWPFSSLETTIPLCGGTGFFCVFSSSTLVGLRSWTCTEMTHLTRNTPLSTLFPPENRPWNWRFRLFAHLKYWLLSQKISIFRNLSIKVALLRRAPDRLQNDEKLAFERLFDCNSPVSGKVILGQPFTRRNCSIRSSKWAIFWENRRKLCPP